MMRATFKGNLCTTNISCNSPANANDETDLITFCSELNNNNNNEKEPETLIETIRIYSQDLGMEFFIKKCSLIKLKNGKRESTEEIELLNQERIRTLGEKENHKYLECICCHSDSN